MVRSTDVDEPGAGWMYVGICWLSRHKLDDVRSDSMCRPL